MEEEIARLRKENQELRDEINNKTTIIMRTENEFAEFKSQYEELLQDLVALKKRKETSGACTQTEPLPPPAELTDAKEKYRRLKSEAKAVYNQSEELQGLLREMYGTDNADEVRHMWRTEGEKLRAATGEMEKASETIASLKRKVEAQREKIARQKRKMMRASQRCMSVIDSKGFL